MNNNKSMLKNEAIEQFAYAKEIIQRALNQVLLLNTICEINEIVSFLHTDEQIINDYDIFCNDIRFT